MILVSMKYFLLIYYRCIISSINDPNVFIMDHLLLLEPVKILEGENIHNVNSIVKVLFQLLYYFSY